MDAEEAKAHLAAIVESSDDAIISKTLEGIIRTWNSAAERLFGYSEAEAVGQPITLIIPPERLDEERSILDRLRRGERVDHFETVRVAKDGRAIDISLTVSPTRDASGRIIGASKVARDITDRKRAETPSGRAKSVIVSRRGGRGGRRRQRQVPRLLRAGDELRRPPGPRRYRRRGEPPLPRRLRLLARRGHRQAVLGMRLVESLARPDGHGPLGLHAGRGAASPSGTDRTTSWPPGTSGWST